MNTQLDRTHQPDAQSWVASANAISTPFPLQNLPYGRATHAAFGPEPRIVVAIGDQVVDVVAVADVCGFDRKAREAAEAIRSGCLNPLIALSPNHAAALRHALFDALDARTPSEHRAPGAALVPIEAANLLLPVEIGDYTDFFCSMHHAINASNIFMRPDPLQPNYHYLPVGYHGRASSVVVSGTPIVRPYGQILPKGDDIPIFAASQMMDYEVEFGLILRGGNDLGSRIPIAQAEDTIFGVCLQNDWSARDIQRWEARPLGPFLSKSIGTTISPWIVTTDALRPFLVAAPERAGDLPAPPPHLTPAHATHTTWRVAIDCALQTAIMRRNGEAGQTISTSHLTDLHWTPKQMVTHHASNGCNLRAGDLIGSGTISGATDESLGCLLERTRDGARPITIGGETRRYLEDEDAVILTALCTAPGARSIGLGVCEGQVLAART